MQDPRRKPGDQGDAPKARANDDAPREAARIARLGLRTGRFAPRGNVPHTKASCLRPYCEQARPETDPDKPRHSKARRRDPKN